MVIQEAIISGKPFKTPEMTDYIEVKGNFLVWSSDRLIVAGLPASFLLSNNFELLNPKDNVVELKNFRKPNLQPIA